MIGVIKRNTGSLDYSSSQNLSVKVHRRLPCQVVRLKLGIYALCA